MGEHSAWDKYTNFDLAHRAPMMLHVPGVIEEVEKKSIFACIMNC